MPPLRQRRNSAYLNRQISRFGQLDRKLANQTLEPGPDWRLISGARSNRTYERKTLALATWTSCFT
jgi:hypothetical protein